MEDSLLQHMVSVRSIKMVENLDNSHEKIMINGIQLDGSGITRVTSTIYGGSRSPFIIVEYHPDYITNRDKKLLEIEK